MVLTANILLKIGLKFQKSYINLIEIYKKEQKSEGFQIMFNFFSELFSESA